MARKKKYDYYKAFEKQAGLMVDEVGVLVDLVKNYEGIDDMAPVLARAHEIETAGDCVNHETYNAIATDFVTPIDSEDLVDISSSLDSIIDEIEDTLMMFWTLDVHVMHEQCLEFIEGLLLPACKALQSAIVEFPHFKKSSNFKSAIAEVNDWEEAADRLHMRVVHDLFEGDRNDPLYVIRWVRIFDKLEACADSCEHVSDVMETVALKDS